MLAEMGSKAFEPKLTRIQHQRLSLETACLDEPLGSLGSEVESWALTSLLSDKECKRGLWTSWNYHYSSARPPKLKVLRVNMRHHQTLKWHVDSFYQWHTPVLAQGGPKLKGTNVITVPHIHKHTTTAYYSYLTVVVFWLLDCLCVWTFDITRCYKCLIKRDQCLKDHSMRPTNPHPHMYEGRTHCLLGIHLGSQP